MDNLNRFKPGVSKNWLYILAGIIWSLVGFMLIRFSVNWIKMEEGGVVFLLVFIGITLAIFIFIFGFSRFAEKNNARIKNYENEKICIFAFQAWTSYPLVAFMISLGIYLRRYSALPKWMLSITYLGIGGGLILSSTHYYIQLLSCIRES